MQTPSFDFHFTTALLYGACALAAWLPVAVGTGPDRQAPSVKRAAIVRAALLAGLLSHGAALGFALFGGDGLNIGFSHAVSLILWLALLAYAVIGFDNRLIRIAALALTPLAALAVLLPLAVPGQRIVHYGGMAFKAHVVVALLAYALFTVASIHALLMLFLERRLHAGSLPPFFQHMPPLLRLERLLFQLLLVAFVLLTATVASGVMFSESLFGRPFQMTHKTVFAIFSWLIFGGLLFGHRQFGWRGRLAIRWTLAGFVLLFLSYVGSKFVLEILLGRA